MKKKIIIIGAGVSGLTAGIYALENNYDVDIYEKHVIAGGECTGWTRKKQYIDGCAHFIVGTNPKSELYPLWIHVGAFTENTVIHNTEYFSKYEIDGETVTCYADLDKLKAELLRIAPEDKRQIKRFIDGVNIYKTVHIPTDKPIDKMHLFPLIRYGISMLRMVPRLVYYMHTSVGKYAKKFKNPILQKFFVIMMNEKYNVHSLFYVQQALALKDAGVIEGGSSKIISNMVNTFKAKGGNLHLRNEADHILIENGITRGIVLKDKTVKKADYVICSTDAHHLLYDLLKGKYKDNYYAKRFNDRKTYPLNQAVFMSFLVRKDLTNMPKMLNIHINGTCIGDYTFNRLSIRNFAFDKTLSTGNNTTLTCLIETPDSVYDYLKGLSREEYIKFKSDLGEKLRKDIMARYGLMDDEIDCIDVATPLTYERYVNAYRGSYMSFITTDKTKGLMRKGYIKGIKNLYISGQWIMAPGGLPIALFTGKHAVYRICFKDKKRFIDLDRKNNKKVKIQKKDDE